MRRIITIFLLTFIAFASYGQLPANFIAPDFTVTDLNGNEHNLYDILDQEKTVIIDIFASWCGPCWTFHNDHVLADIWDELGPDGTDEVFVLSIESDLATGQADLEGGNGSQGDWIAGTPYPIIDEIEGFEGVGKIARDYLVWGYPTIYFICPDKSVTELNWQEVAANYNSIIQSCPDPQGQNNGKLINYIGVEGIICEEQTFAPKAIFQNRGTQIMEQATFEITINGTTEEINWTGSLNPFGLSEIEFSSVDASSTDITVELTSVNNVADEFPDDNTLSSFIVLPNATQNQTINIEIMTDEYGEDTYWAILNESDEVVAEGGNLAIGFDLNVNNQNGDDAPTNLGAYEANTLYVEEVLISTSGCHRFVIADYFLDGICCNNGEGYFKVVSQDNGVLVDGTGTDFDVSSSNPFIFNGAVGTNETILADLKMFPNPLLDELTINIAENNFNIETINILDLQGKTIVSSNNFNTSNRNINLDLTSLQAGLYFIEVIFEDGSTAQKKLVKQQSN